MIHEAYTAPRRGSPLSTDVANIGAAISRHHVRMRICGGVDGEGAASFGDVC